MISLLFSISSLMYERDHSLLSTSLMQNAFSLALLNYSRSLEIVNVKLFFLPMIDKPSLRVILIFIIVSPIINYLHRKNTNLF
nr:MAG TPA: hypothetical protein [Caudoviricetes sp.]